MTGKVLIFLLEGPYTVGSFYIPIYLLLLFNLLVCVAKSIERIIVGFFWLGRG